MRDLLGDQAEEPDVGEVRVLGLEGTRYLDKVDGGTEGSGGWSASSCTRPGT